MLNTLTFLREGFCMKNLFLILLGLSVSFVACGQTGSMNLQPYTHIRWNSGDIITCPEGYVPATYTNGMMTCKAQTKRFATSSMTVPPSGSVDSWPVASPNTHIRWSIGSWIQCPDGTQPYINRDGTMTCMNQE